MKKGALTPIALFQKASTPLGTAGLLVLVEITWPVLPAWLRLFGLPLNSLSIQFHKMLMLVFCMMASISLAAVMLGQQVRRFKLVRRPPCREVAYYPIRSATNTLLGFTVVPGILLWAIFVPIPLRLLLHVTILILLVSCHYELSDQRETAVCELARKFPRNSADRRAILVASRGWTSFIAGVLTVEVAAMLIWKVTGSKDIALGAGLASLALCMPCFAVLFWSSVKMVRRIKIDLAYQEKKEQEEAVATKGPQEKRHDP
jgi:hypothetical protein